MSGELAAYDVSPEDLSQGKFHLRSPFSVPEARGPIIANVFPTYSPGNGLSEWGMGWRSSDIVIYRSRVLGAIQFDDEDDLSGPWGPMRRGSDGYYYPLGLRSNVFVSVSGSELHATLADGTVWVFGGDNRVETARGTYSWYLSYVRTLHNRQLRLEYLPDGGGRRFYLSKALYGGWAPGDLTDPQYQIDFEYEPMGIGFEDYRSGERSVLSRRVRTIRIRPKNLDTGMFDELYRYELDYDAGTAGSYLTRIAEVRHGGGTLVRTYKYQLSWASGNIAYPPKPQLVVSAGTLPIVPLELQRGHLLEDAAFHTPTDINQDGITDFEWNLGYGAWVHDKHQTYVAKPLFRPPTADPHCLEGLQADAASLPWRNRVLATFRPWVQLWEREPLTIAFTSEVDTFTTIHVCKRSGTVLDQVQLARDKHSQDMPADGWGPRTGTRIVDLNLDRKPDIVAFPGTGRMAFLPNTAADALAGTAYQPRFGLHDNTGLRTFIEIPGLGAGPGRVAQHDIADVNGDGLPDIVMFDASSPEIVVWFHRGTTEIWDSAPSGQPIKVQIPLFSSPALYERPIGDDGSLALIDAASAPGDRGRPGTRCHFSVVDVDSDGLGDLMAICPSSPQNLLPGRVSIFMNRGYQSAQRRMFGEEVLLATNYANALVANMRAGGRTDLVLIGHASAPQFFQCPAGTALQANFVCTRRVDAVTLHDAGDGLLTEARDGRGNIVQFRYDWGPNQDGLGRPPVVLSFLSRTTTGAATRATTFEYSSAQRHQPGGFFAGYNLVTVKETEHEYPYNFDVDVSEHRFSHEDREGTRLLGTTRYSTAGTLVSDTIIAYDDGVIAGIPIVRAAQVSESWGTKQPAATTYAVEALRLKAITRYEYPSSSAWCPSKTQVLWGDQTGLAQDVEIEYAAPARLAMALSCLPAKITTVGRHPDTTLDYASVVTVTYDENGLKTDITSAPSASDKLQYCRATYHQDGSLHTVDVPGSGTAMFDLGFSSHLQSTFTEPSGVVHRLNYDPWTGHLVSDSTMRGGQAYTRWYGHDAWDRLTAIWDDLNGGSAAEPLVSFEHRFASGTSPAVVIAKALVDPAEGAFRQTATYFSADGEPYATAVRGTAGWVVSSVLKRAPRRLDLVRRKVPLIDEALSASTNELGQPSEQLGSSSTTSLGYGSSSTIALPFGKTLKIETDAGMLDGSDLLLRSRKNGKDAAQTRLSSMGTPILHVDEEGHEYHFTYDVAGRLRRLLLPDLSRYVISYDDHGRKRSVERTGISRIEYEYRPGTRLIQKKTTTGRTHASVRTEQLTYNAWGALESHIHQEGNDQVEYHYTHGSPVGAQAGLLTAVAGPQFSKTYAYRPDSSLESDEAVIATTQGGTGPPGSQVKLRRRYSYFSDGSRRSIELHAIRATDATVIEALIQETKVDGYGRPEQLLLNEAVAADLYYDDEGLMDEALLSNGGALRFFHDPRTRDFVGFVRLQGPALADPFALRLVVNDDGRIDSETVRVLANQFVSKYSYSPTGRLVSAHVPVPSLSQPSSLKYEYDAVGHLSKISSAGGLKNIVRTPDYVKVGDSSFDMDGFGRISRLGDKTVHYGPDGQLRGVDDDVRYIVDEVGYRLARIEGSSYHAFLDGAIVDDSGITAPLTAGGVTFGLWGHGSWASSVSDTRGSPIATGDAPADFQSPYGGAPPVMAPTHGFVAAVQDPATHTVRFGVRDYLPELGQFLTPDPLLLEFPELALDRPREFALYSYAAGDPVNHVDRTGLAAGCTESDICITLKEEPPKPPEKEEAPKPPPAELFPGADPVATISAEPITTINGKDTMSRWPNAVRRRVHMADVYQRWSSDSVRSSVRSILRGDFDSARFFWDQAIEQKAVADELDIAVVAGVGGRSAKQVAALKRLSAAPGNPLKLPSWIRGHFENEIRRVGNSPYRWSNPPGMFAEHPHGRPFFKVGNTSDRLHWGTWWENHINRVREMGQQLHKTLDLPPWW